jgi:hypothetical protein
VEERCKKGSVSESSGRVKDGGSQSSLMEETQRKEERFQKERV